MLKNCSDSVKDDQSFKDASIQYKAFLLKSGYDEDLIDKKFINYEIRNKRKNILKIYHERKGRKIKKSENIGLLLTLDSLFLQSK